MSKSERGTEYEGEREAVLSKYFCAGDLQVEYVKGKYTIYVYHII